MQENLNIEDPLGILTKKELDPLGILKKKDGGKSSEASTSQLQLSSQETKLKDLRDKLGIGAIRPTQTELPSQLQKSKQIAEFEQQKESSTPKVSQMMVYSKPTFKVEYPEAQELNAKVLGFKSAADLESFKSDKTESDQKKVQEATDKFYNTSVGKLYFNFFQPLAESGARAIRNTGATIARLFNEDDLANAIVDRFTPEKQYKGTIAGNKPTKLQGGLFNDGKMNMAKLPSTVVKGLTDMSFLIAPAGAVGKGGQALGLSEKAAQTTGLIASSYLQSREDYYQEGKASGLKGDQLDNFATGSAALTSALEALFPNQIALGGFRNKMAKEYAKQIAQGVTAKTALKSGIKEVLKESFVKEPTQEVLQLAGDKVAKVLSDMSSGENNFGDQLDWEKNKDELYETLVITPIISTIASGSGALKSYSPTNYEKSLFYDASKNADKVNQFLDNKFIQNEITEEQYTQGKNKFKNYKNAVDQVKNLGYSEDQTLQMAWEVFSGKEKLPTTQSVIADPILKDALGGEIKKDKESIAENIRMIGMGVPNVGSEIDGKEVSFVISNIGDKGKEVDQTLVDNIGDDTYRVEEVNVKDLYNSDPEFKSYVDQYQKGSVDQNSLMVPAVMKGGKIIDGRARLAEQYISGKDTVKVFNQINDSFAPELSIIESINIDKSALATNTNSEVERLKTAELGPDDGVTLNMDGTKYEGGGLIVPIGSINTTQEELTPELIADFAEKNKSKLSSDQTFKFGLYKFPNSNQVSIDLNIVTDPKNKDIALEFGKMAGQESLFDLSTFSNVPTGADGQNPASFNDEQIREIGKAFEEGRMPNVFGKRTKIADELMSELGAPIDEKLSEVIPIAEKSLERTGVKFKVVDGSTGDQQANAARGNQGLFVSGDGTIIIDKSKIADELEAGLVVWHEASHPVMNVIRNTNKPLYDKVVNGLVEASKQNKDIADAINWAKSQPQYDNTDTQNDEAVVETIGRINAGVIDISKLSTSLRQSIIDFVNSIAKFFGIDPILNDTDLAAFKKTVGQVADALKTGRDIAEVVGEENVKRFDANSVQSRADSEKVAKDTEDRVIESATQPSMVLVGKKKGEDVVLYSGPASIESMRAIKPLMYISRAEDLANTHLVPGKVRLYNSNAQRDQKLKWADKVYEQAKVTVVSNLNYIFDQIPESIRNISKLWYDGANIISQELASKYGTTIEQAAAVIAAQSPQKPWYDNVHLAHFIIDFYSTKKNEVFTKEMFDYFELKSRPSTETPKGYPKQQQYLPTLKKSIGKKFSELSNYDKSVMIRAEFDNKYERTAPLRVPTGDIVGRVSDMSSFSGYDTIAKGVSILDNGSEENISKNLGKAFKVRNFNNNISNPKMDGEVTIDTHAIAAGYMLPLGSSSGEVNFDAATYAFFADAYRESARQKGVLPRELQSIVWEGARALFPDTAKEDADKAKAKAIWSNYKNSSLPLSDVQEQIKNNGKDLSNTDWARFSDTIFKGDGQRNYLEELPLASRDKSAAGSGDGSINSRGLPAMGGGGDATSQASVGNRPELSRQFKIASFVMRKIGEGESESDIISGVSSATGMSSEEVRSIISDPEQYIRNSFPELSKIAQDNLIERAKIQNIYRGHNAPVNPAFTGMEVPRSKVVEYLNKTNKRQDGFKKTVKDFKNKYLDPAKGLPDWTMAIKDFAAGSKNVEVARAVRTIERLKAEAKKVGFKDWESFSKAMVAVSDVKRYIPDTNEVAMFDPYRASEGKAFTTPDDMLPAVIPDALKALPESIRPFAVQMRQQIDGITKDLIGSGYVTPEQAVTLEKNIGQYVNRSYRMFNEKGFKPDPDQKVDAIKFIADQKFKQILSELFPAGKPSASREVSDFKGNVIDPDNVNMDALYEQAVEEAKKDVEAIVDKKRNPYFSNKMDSRDTGILKEKKDIPEPIRKLMGEYTDPGTVFVMTVAKQAALRAQSEYLTSLRESGMGSLFFEKDDPKRPAEYSIEIASTGTESKSPLGGLYTTPEIAEAIENAEPTYNELTQLWMKLVGAVRWGKTVGSVVTQAKNFESNLGFAVLNGLLYTGKNTQAFKGAAKYVKGQYSKNEIDQITEKLIELNLVNQSVGARELADMLGSGDIHDIALEIAASPNSQWGKKVKKNVNVIAVLNKAYRMSDDFWKAYAYLNERQQVANGRYKKSYESLTPEEQGEVDIESSERVKNTWPTYDRVVEGAKFLSKRAPIFGNFISFQAESIRVLINSVKLAKQDLQDPQMKASGMRRAAGIATYLGLRALITTTVASAAGMAASGILGAALGDDEEEQKKRAIKKALPIYARPADIAAIQTEEPHKYIVYSLSSLDPYGIIFNSLNAYTEGREGVFSKEMEPGVPAALAEFFSGFMEPEMTFSTAYSVLNNINPKTGRPIVLDSDTSDEVASKVLGFIANELKPSTIGLIERGMERGWKPEAASILSARPIDVDLHRSFGFALTDMAKQMDAIKNEYSAVKYKKESTEEEKANAEKEAENKKAYLISKVAETYRDFIKIGADPKVLNEMISERSGIKTTGFDKVTKRAIKTGEVNPEKLFK